MQENEKALVAVQPEKGEEKPKSYWLRVSLAYTMLYRALLLVLPVFAVLFVITCPRAFSYNSLFCFVKDLQSVSSFAPSEYKTVSYTYREGESRTLSYHGCVANVSTGGIEVYSPGGERLLDVPLQLQAPRAAASDKYLIAYDFGKTGFTVTNAYARLHSGKTEFPIYGASVADTGHIALITSSEQHLSQVLLYDVNFNLLQRFGRASATTAVSVSNNGRYVAITGISSHEGKRQSVVDLYRVGIQAPVFSITLEGELSLALSFTDNRHLALLTDTALRVLQLDGEWKDEIPFKGAVPVAFDFNENGALVCVQKDALTAENRVIQLNKRGEVLRDEALSGDVRSVTLAKRVAVVLLTDRLCSALGENAWQERALEGVGALDTFVIDGEQLRVVYPDKAVYLPLDGE